MPKMKANFYDCIVTNIFNSDLQGVIKMKLLKLFNEKNLERFMTLVRVLDAILKFFNDSWRLSSSVYIHHFAIEKITVLVRLFLHLVLGFLRF